jgi:hypothetical protein
MKSANQHGCQIGGHACNLGRVEDLFGIAPRVVEDDPDRRRCDRYRFLDWRIRWSIVVLALIRITSP